eukprot:Lithocolla_globosa_v1_NODE_3075_length_1767_cov_31.751748.p2 type:complete len:152 gc:universal NODE_3075_length_1767_cov_31.751748:1604-1149(-)
MQEWRTICWLKHRAVWGDASIRSALARTRSSRRGATGFKDSTGTVCSICSKTTKLKWSRPITTTTNFMMPPLRKERDRSETMHSTTTVSARGGTVHTSSGINTTAYGTRPGKSWKTLPVQGKCSQNVAGTSKTQWTRWWSSLTLNSSGELN